MQEKVCLIANTSQTHKAHSAKDGQQTSAVCSLFVVRFLRCEHYDLSTGRRHILNRIFPRWSFPPSLLGASWLAVLHEIKGQPAGRSLAAAGFQGVLVSHVWPEHGRDGNGIVGALVVLHDGR